MNLLDLLRANTQPGGAAGMVDRGQDPGGIASLLQSARSPATLAASAPPPQSHPNRRRVFGIIGDALAGLNGQPGVYAETMNKRAELGQQSQLEQQRWQQQQQWKHDNPDTPAEIEAANAVTAMTPDQQAQFARSRDLISPTVQTGPQGAVVVPRSYVVNGMNGAAGGGTHGSTTPLGGVFTDPASGRKFRRIAPGDAQESWQEVGGPSPAGSGGFR